MTHLELLNAAENDLPEYHSVEGRLEIAEALVLLICLKVRDVPDIPIGISDYYCCPNCNSELTGIVKYCSDCGQAISWNYESEEDDENDQK